MTNLTPAQAASGSTVSGSTASGSTVSGSTVSGTSLIDTKKLIGSDAKSRREAYVRDPGAYTGKESTWADEPWRAYDVVDMTGDPRLQNQPDYSDTTVYPNTNVQPTVYDPNSGERRQRTLQEILQGIQSIGGHTSTYDWSQNPTVVGVRGRDEGLGWLLGDTPWGRQVSYNDILAYTNNNEAQAQSLFNALASPGNWGGGGYNETTSGGVGTGAFGNLGVMQGGGRGYGMTLNTGGRWLSEQTDPSTGQSFWFMEDPRMEGSGVVGNVQPERKGPWQIGTNPGMITRVTSEGTNPYY